MLDSHWGLFNSGCIAFNSALIRAMNWSAVSSAGVVPELEADGAVVPGTGDLSQAARPSTAVAMLNASRARMGFMQVT